MCKYLKKWWISRSMSITHEKISPIAEKTIKNKLKLAESLTAAVAGYLKVNPILRAAKGQQKKRKKKGFKIPIMGQI